MIILMILITTTTIKKSKFLNLINITVNGRSLSLDSSSLLYSFGIIILLLKEESEPSILPT